MRLRVVWRVLILLGFCLLLSSCGREEKEPKKLRDLEFTVLSEEKIPEECLQMVEGKKQNPFQFTYKDGQYLYICAGFGEQETGGYCISVNALYLTENAIYVETNLLGPKAGSNPPAAKTYPYVVLKTEYMDRNVVFD